MTLCEHGQIVWKDHAPEHEIIEFCDLHHADKPMIVDFGRDTTLWLTIHMDQNDARDRYNLKLRINEWLLHPDATILSRRIN